MYDDYAPSRAYGNLSQEDKDKLNRLLSMTNISSQGTIDGVPNRTLAALMGNQATAQPMPENYIQNLSTGQVTPLKSNQPSGPVLDYAQPVEIGGVGKGYRVKGDPFTAVLPDGRIVRMGEDVAASRRAQIQDLQLQKAKQELTAKQLSSAERAYGETMGQGRAAAELSNVPGTPQHAAAQKAAAAEEARIRALETREATQQARSKTVLDAVEDAKNQVGFFSTGATGQVLRNMGGTSAMDLNQTLSTIKANLGFEELQKMREASKTGGALGQVAVKELEFLQSAVSSLDTAQSADRLKKNLEKVKQHYSNWEKIINKASGGGESSAGYDTGKEQRYQEWKRRQGLQ